ncbi:MAG: glycosyltransferase family 1 protein [Candidatus Andersenbacteria bacterium]
MHIAIEARSLSASMGIKTYTRELLRELSRDSAATYSVIYDNARHEGTFTHMRELTVPLSHEALLLLWLWWQVPWALRRLRPDVVHFTKAAVPLKKIAPTVVTIYDVIPLLFPQSQRLTRRWYWPLTLVHAARTSDHIITISDSSKRDISNHLQVPLEKITVTPLAVNQQQFTRAGEAAIQQFRQATQLLNPYILFVGTLEPRKNIPALIAAFSAIAATVPHDLVIAGKRGRGYEAVLRAKSRSVVAARIKILEMVSPLNLPTLYSGADLFVWPSVYEGWGLPPLEAMACGTPIIVSDGGALPEVVGRAGIVVPFGVGVIAKRTGDRDFQSRLSQAIKALAQDEQKKIALRQAGQMHVQGFSWAQVAETTRAVYASLV